MPPSLPATMSAWAASSYGGPDTLRSITMPLPQPTGNQILIKIQATTVSSGDRRIRAMDFPDGMRLLGRAVFGLSGPRQPILGTECTGIVAALGPKATQFQIGDAVIAFTGMKMGCHAEYCLIHETGLVAKRPTTMTLETAAALGFGGTTARDFLRRAHLKANETIMVIGASGTVGSALVQLAAHQGAIVTGVTSGQNADCVRQLGATAIIDYQTHDIQNHGPFDIIADTIGGLTFKGALPLLTAGGRYLAINGSLGEMLARPRNGIRCIAGPAAERPDDFETIISLVTNNHFNPLIDCTMPFSDMPKAHARVDSGRKKGSVVMMLPS